MESRGGSIPSSAKNSSVAARVPEPASRTSHVARASGPVPNASRRDDDEFVRARRERAEWGPVWRPPGEDEIDLPVSEAVPDVRVITDVELDLDARLSQAKTLQELRDEVLRGRRDRRQTQPARSGLGQLAGALAGLVDEREDPAAVEFERAASSGQAHSATITLGELGADRALQAGKRRGDGRLRDDQRICRLLHRSQARDFQKRPQLVQR